MVTKPTATKKKQARNGTYNTNDWTLLHFMLINDAIVELSQPPLVPNGTVLVVDVNKIKAVVKRNSSASGQLEEIATLRNQINACARTIDKIHKIANHAIDKFDAVDVGGRKPAVETKVATEIANEYYAQHAQFPRAKKLLDLVCERLFKQDPQAYIDRVSKSMTQEVVATHRRDPTWGYWKNAPRPCSESTMRNILINLREKRKIFA